MILLLSFIFLPFFSGIGSTGNVTYGGVTYYCDLCPGGTACEATGLTGYSAGVSEKVSEFLLFLLLSYLLFWCFFCITFYCFILLFFVILGHFL